MSNHIVAKRNGIKIPFLENYSVKLIWPPRRTFSRSMISARWLFGLLLVLANVLTSSTAGSDSPAATSSDTNRKSKSPNILFIAIDDQNDWVGPLKGHSMAITPHMDQLATRGTTFGNAHCQAPLCNPSRTSVMLGRRPSSTGVYGLAPWFRDVPALANSTTLAQRFQQAGYRTMCAGKIFHGPPGPARRPGAEFDEWGPGGGIGITPPQKLIPATPMGNHPLMDWGSFPHEDSEKGDYQVASWGIEKIRDADKDQPFFLALGFFLPHVPCYAPPHWFEGLPEDASILPEIHVDDRADTPRFSWYLHWYLPEPRLAWVERNQQWIPLVRSYLACTRFVDHQIGRLLQAVKDAGLEDDTIIVLWSDHGYHLGEKGITGKNTLWERSTRVPLILAGPGVGHSQYCEEPVELMDIYPTLLELCGLPNQPELEGISLRPQLRDPAARRTRPAITTHNQGNHSIRTRRWRYIRYADQSEELYDLEQDPHEWNNLANDATHAANLDRLRVWLPAKDVAPVEGSQHRVLTYDQATDTAIWEGKPILRADPIPN